MTPLELLAPARNTETAIQAILHGADAVYIGARSHGARSKAGNSISDIRSLVEFAAPYGVKVYVTVNTLVYDNEIAAVEQLVRDLYHAGVDALIVQDMALLEMDIPPIELHASTQCDTRTADKARFLAEAGFAQIVVPRELSLAEIKEIALATPGTKLEAFVHGALCVCYSGDCQASFAATGRSANRGECAQICRLPFELLNSDGKSAGPRRHYLSLKDMNRLSDLAEMADAGITSFKIEGRLKDPAYVKNVTAAYRAAIDSVIAANPDRYCRASRGIAHTSFTPSLERAFNRGFTSYFLHPADNDHLSSPLTPKSIGLEAGTVVTTSGNKLKGRFNRLISNGDGLSYITPDGSVGGFRVNRAENSTLILQQPIKLPSGTKLFRSYDRLWEQSLEQATATRLIPIDITLSTIGNSRIAFSATTSDGIGPVEVVADTPLSPSKKPDNGYRQSVIAKLGGTIYTLNSLTDNADGLFIPASVLTELRRRLVDALTATLTARRQSPPRRPDNLSPTLPDSMRRLSRHDNVANSLARDFYLRAGAESIDPALETDPQFIARQSKSVAADSKANGLRVMTTKFCLRRELGQCLKKHQLPAEKRPLYLRGENLLYRLDFDCANCRMTVTHLSPAKFPKR